LAAPLGLLVILLPPFFLMKFLKSLSGIPPGIQLSDISAVYFLILMVFYSISLMGAIRMWKLHRDGYFLYVPAQLVILLLPVIWINLQALSVTNTFFTIVFIAGYTLNMKFLKQ
jgi:hypothetical protein